MSFVRRGLSIQREIVTKADAPIGSILKAELKVLTPKIKFIAINRQGHKKRLAHLCFFRNINTISRSMPTAFGIRPAIAPRQR